MRIRLLFVAVFLCVLKSLHAQADLSVSLVQIYNLGCDHLACLQNIRRLLYMLSGDLGNMKQCVYAGLQLYECAEVCHTCNSSLYHVAYCILLSSV